MEVGGSVVFSNKKSGKRIQWADSSNDSQPDYGVDIENSKVNGFSKNRLFISR